MKTIQISRQLCQLYQSENHNLDYVLSELLGMADYKRCAALTPLPMRTTDELATVSISDQTHEQLSLKFRGQTELTPAVEVLLWYNYFMGMDL